MTPVRMEGSAPRRRAAPPVAACPDVGRLSGNSTACAQPVHRGDWGLGFGPLFRTSTESWPRPRSPALPVQAGTAGCRPATGHTTLSSTQTGVAHALAVSGYRASNRRNTPRHSSRQYRTRQGDSRSGMTDRGELRNSAAAPDCLGRLSYRPDSKTERPNARTPMGARITPPPLPAVPFRRTAFPAAPSAERRPSRGWRP